VTGRRGRKRKQLRDVNIKGRYWKLQEEALDRTLVENSLWKRLWALS
jgi:hypothetical protein